MSEINYGKAVIECPQEIPCNPCVTICGTGAITKESLTALPVLDQSKCFGCRRCVAACPGQAIFMVNREWEPGFASVSFPYEYRPLPVTGKTVEAVDREGRRVTEATVLAVDNRQSFNRTAVVTIRIPAKYADTVRFITRLKEERS